MKNAAGQNQQEMERNVRNGEPGIVSAERLPNVLNRGAMTCEGSHCDGIWFLS